MANANTRRATGFQVCREFRWWWPLRQFVSTDEASEDPAEKMRRLEAVLFVTREPMPTRKLSQLAGLADGTEARTLIRRLNESYDELSRAFRVEEVAGGYQLMTRRKLAAWIRRLQHTPSEVRLSAPAMETLAVVAYRQPVLRADIEAVRGVNCGEILRQLMERNLVRISGRSEELGRPYLYSTTKRFLQLFGLKNLDTLPRIDQLRGGPVASVVKQQDNSSETGTSETMVHSDDRPEEDSDVSVSLANATAAATEDLLAADAAMSPAESSSADSSEQLVSESSELEDDEYEDDDDDLDDDEEDDDYGDGYDDDDDDDDDDEVDDDDMDEDFDDDDWEEVEDDDEDDDDDDEDDDWESELEEDDDFEDEEDGDDADDDDEEDDDEEEDAGDEDEEEEGEWE